MGPKFGHPGSDVDLHARRNRCRRTVKGELSGYGLANGLTGRAGNSRGDQTPADAFFNTSLLPYLIRGGLDSLIVTGVTTSGCVRATGYAAASSPEGRI
jgi:hypothetical protein